MQESWGYMWLHKQNQLTTFRVLNLYFYLKLRFQNMYFLPRQCMSEKNWSLFWIPQKSKASLEFLSIYPSHPFIYPSIHPSIPQAIH